MTYEPFQDLFYRLQRRTGENGIDEGRTTRKLDCQRYLDADDFARESEALFCDLPIVICHGSDIPTGGVLAFDHLQKPLLLTRDKAGTVHGFINACRHRGTRLVDEDGVCKKTRIICPYHAWSYRLNGELAAVPLEKEAFPGLDKGQLGLISLPTREVGGLVFVQQNPKSPVDIDKFLAPLADDLDALSVKTHLVFAKQPTRVRANWKLLADAFLESYHIQRLHTRTLASFFMDGITDMDTLGLHMRSAIARADLNSVSSPPEDGFHLRSLVTYSYTLFPNATLIISPDYINLLAFYPVAIDQTMVIDSMIIPQAPDSDEERDHWHKSFHLIDTGVFQSEDYEAARRSQMGIESGMIKAMTLGHYEVGMAMFHDQRDALLAGKLPASVLK